MESKTRHETTRHTPINQTDAWTFTNGRTLSDASLYADGARYHNATVAGIAGDSFGECVAITVNATIDDERSAASAVFVSYEVAESLHKQLSEVLGLRKGK